MEQTIKVGDRRQITSNSLFGIATATKVDEIDTDNQKGILVSFRFDDTGYETNPYFFENGEILNSRIDERKGRSGMPKEHAKCTAKDFGWNCYGEDTAPQKKIANDFIVNFGKYLLSGRGLYIYSETKGSGKTKLACIITNEILKRRDISVRFISVTEYIELIKRKDDESRNEIDARLHAGLLVVDDIGVQTENKDWITTAMYRLIDVRYTEHLPTVYTSNVEITSLKTDSRILERIYEVSIRLPMPEVNIRRKIADRHTEKFLSELLNDSDGENIWDNP